MDGPMLQPELFEILKHFHTYPVAFSTDIGKMYRQIEIHSNDQPSQSILGEDSLADKIIVYELTTLTYRSALASFIATKCLQILVEVFN